MASHEIISYRKCGKSCLGGRLRGHGWTPPALLLRISEPGCCRWRDFTQVFCVLHKTVTQVLKKNKKNHAKS